MTSNHSKEVKQPLCLSGLLKTIGPGIIYAGAAIGASHIVMSTRAGANYSFQLIWIVLLINLFKYPFFEFGYRYTAATGKNMLQGYREIGNWAIITFFVLNLCTAVVNFAAVTIVTSGLASYFFNIEFNPFYINIILLASILMILFIGRYAVLDTILKLMIVALAILTVTAFIQAISIGSQAKPGFIPPVLWDATGIIFIVALMGWMPTPIEASVWPSLWAIERSKQTKYKPNLRESLVDFHIGYVGSAVMAIFFLGLGALVMYGTGEKFSSSGVEFSQQIVALYSKTLGSWSHSIIAAIVLLTMFSTALTVIDGYPRTLESSMIEIFPRMKRYNKKLYYFWAIFLALSAALIIGVFAKNMKALLFFATIISFLAAPAFAIFNYKVVTSKSIPAEAQPRRWLKILSWMGIAFLIGFSVLFLVSKFAF